MTLYDALIAEADCAWSVPNFVTGRAWMVNGKVRCSLRNGSEITIHWVTPAVKTALEQSVHVVQVLILQPQGIGIIVSYA